MVKTITLSAGLNTVDMSGGDNYFYVNNRYWNVKNKGGNTIYISSAETCSEGADGSKEVPAGETAGYDMTDRNIMYIYSESAGSVQIDTGSEQARMGFKGNVKGGVSILKAYEAELYGSEVEVEISTLEEV